MFKKVGTNTELGNTELLLSSRTSLRNSGLILSADHDVTLLCVISNVKAERTATAIMTESGLSLSSQHVPEPVHRRPRLDRWSLAHQIVKSPTTTIPENRGTE